MLWGCMHKPPHEVPSRQFAPPVTQLYRALGTSWTVTFNTLFDWSVFPCGGRANARLVCDHPPTGVRRQAACCVSSIRGSFSALGIIWVAYTFQYRSHPSFSIRRVRSRGGPFSNKKKICTNFYPNPQSVIV